MGCSSSKPEPEPVKRSTLRIVQPPRQNDPVKTAILGHIGVGKTRFALQISGKISEFKDQSTSAAGNNVTKNLDIPGYGLTVVAFWDTAGEERYFSVSKNFIRNADALIFLYAIDNRESFEQLDTFWIPKAFGVLDINNTKVYLLGNKCDLVGKEDRPAHFVSYQEGKDYAEARGYFFEEVSALKNLKLDECAVSLALAVLNARKIE